MGKINVTRTSLPPFEEFCEEIRPLWDSHIVTNMGALHEELSSRLRDFLGVSGLALYTNGHLALEAAIRSFGFPQGSEVITTPLTFVSTTHAIVRCGLVPVFGDVLPDGTLDPECVGKLAGPRTVAVLPVHVWGNPCDVLAFESVCKRLGLRLIYDAAHAFGVSLDGKGLAGFGDVSILSFHATKVFSTVEGGAVCFRDAGLSRFFDDEKNFGIRDEEHCELAGGNAKMGELQAAMGLCNLRHIGEELSSRKAVYGMYISELEDIGGLRVVQPRPGTESNHAYLPVLLGSFEDRERVCSALAAEGINARKYFYPLTFEAGCYGGKSGSGLFRGADETPVAHDISRRVLCLPLYPGLEGEDVGRICRIIRKQVK